MLPNEARVRITNAQRLNRLPTVDESILIIEDEYGLLLHAEGDLSFLIPSVPVLDIESRIQLHPEIQDAYWMRQHYVWDLYDMEHREPLVVGGRQAFFLPMSVDGEKYTITVFSNC